MTGTEVLCPLDESILDSSQVDCRSCSCSCWRGWLLGEGMQVATLDNLSPLSMIQVVFVNVDDPDVSTKA